MTQPLDHRTEQRDHPGLGAYPTPARLQEGSTDDPDPGAPRRGKVIYHDQSEYRKGVGVVTRPVALPEDVADPDMPKASGVVELPLHIHWWEPFSYDLDNPPHRQELYRHVLTDGTPDDVRRYIDIPKLVEMWDYIMLPSHVEYVWGPWLREKGLLP